MWMKTKMYMDFWTDTKSNGNKQRKEKKRMKTKYDYIIVKDGKKTKAKNKKEAYSKTKSADAYLIICKKNSVKERMTGAEVEQKNIIRYHKTKMKPKRETTKELYKMTMDEVKYRNEMLKDERHIWYNN